MACWFRVQEIGMIRRPCDEAADPSAFLDPWAESVIEIFPSWEPGLAGIEDFSHLVVMFYLDRAQRRRSPGTSSPAEGVDRLDPVGFFATRTPKRPNPIGLSCPSLVRRDGPRLIVKGIDAWDGTPIIDLKGYYPRDECRPEASVPEWLTELWDQHDQERTERH
jgi:tRNA (adenine37-N6)-methyltransferase